ncbi:uncharacterized protein [Cherax quadricarinatus]|uniref:uncharacterized protein n=1 Tax=Cherax quadricarinatus TaxID=27406 RepID=UPI002379AEA9|nr:uncharacterized protein LOC128689583 [Cherax quadricarinatus]
MENSYILGYWEVVRWVGRSVERRVECQQLEPPIPTPETLQSTYPAGGAAEDAFRKPEYVWRTMTGVLKRLTVLLTSLLTCSLALDTLETKQGNTEVLQTEGRILSYGNPEAAGIFFVQICTMTVLTLSAVYMIYVIFLPPVRQRAFSWSLWDLMPASPSWDDFNLLDQVLRSVDAVESTLTAVEEDSQACRDLIFCELRQASTRIPVIDAFLQYFRPSKRELEKYKDGQEDDMALENCRMLFAECSISLARTYWDNQ